MNYTAQSVWPVMLTPFTTTGAIDYHALQALIEWYEQSGVDGLFAVCQSSEMFHLSLAERVELAAFIKKTAKVPVIASGHISDAPEDQVDELTRIAGTGVDAVILLSNRLASQQEDSSVWRKSLDFLLEKLDPSLTLGFYECPFPYKRLLTGEELRFLASTNRFRFIKDTCCDIDLIRQRLAVLEGSGLRLYNANIATLLDSLRAGASGFSGVMANFHPELFVWLTRNWNQNPELAERVQAMLTMCSQIEKQLYPVNAKYHLQTKGLPIDTYTRVKDHRDLSPLFQDEVRQMDQIITWFKQACDIR